MNNPTGFCRQCGLVAASVLFITLAIPPAPVWAGTKLSGSPGAITVVAQDSSIREILALLSHDFQMQYRMPSYLNDRVTGTYKGSLQQVVTRILEGHDFVVESNPGGRLAVTVFGGVKTSGASAQSNVAVSGPVRQPILQNPAHSRRQRAWQ